MKKIFTLIAFLMATVAAMAANVKLVEDNTTLGGGTIPATPFSIDWTSQSVVANLDMTAETGTNVNVMSISDNASDVGEWNVTNGYTLHFFYTNDDQVWTTNNKMEALYHTFTIQFREAGVSTTPTVYVQNVADPANVKIEIKQDGVYVDGELKMEASVITDFYTSSSLYFGCLQGSDRSQATYKSVEVVDNGGTVDPDQPTIVSSKVFEGEQAMSQYMPAGDDNAQVKYFKNASAQLTQYSDDTYSVTFNGVAVGNDNISLGNITINGLTKQESSITLEEPTTVVVDAEGSPLNGATLRVLQIDVQANEDDLFAQVYLSTPDGSLAAYQFGDVFIPEEKEITDEAHVTYDGTTNDYTDAKVVLAQVMKDVYSVTFKNLALNGKVVGDFTIENLKQTESDGTYTFTTPDTKGEWSNVTEDGVAAGYAEGDETEFSDFSASVTVADDEALKLVLKFTVADNEVVFGESLPTPPVDPTETVIFEDYQADGTGFSKTATIDWTTQKIVMSIDPSSCQRSVEHLFGVGVDGTAWNNNAHLYRSSDGQLQSYFGGASNNGNSGKFDGGNEEIKVEISTEKGLCVNDVTRTSAADCSALFNMTDIVIASGEASNQESYALYKFVKIVPLSWEWPTTDGISTVNTTVAAPAQIFTINGTRVNALQKGINIVRTADGKTVKVLK